MEHGRITPLAPYLSIRTVKYPANHRLRINAFHSRPSVKRGLMDTFRLLLYMSSFSFCLSASVY